MKNIRFIKFEAKTADELEILINEKAQQLTVVSIYSTGPRHYAWFSSPTGHTISKVKTKTVIHDHKKEKVKIGE